MTEVSSQLERIETASQSELRNLQLQRLEWSLRHAYDNVPHYRTRDLTKLLPPTSRSMRRMAKIIGRADDMLIIRGVNVFPTQIEELILKVPALAPHYVLEVERQGHLDSLTIRVEWATPPGSEPEPDAAEALEQLVKSLVGIRARIVVGEPGSIERSAGKARHVIDNRALYD